MSPRIGETGIEDVPDNERTRLDTQGDRESFVQALGEIEQAQKLLKLAQIRLSLIDDRTRYVEAVHEIANVAIRDLVGNGVVHLLIVENDGKLS